MDAPKSPIQAGEQPVVTPAQRFVDHLETGRPDPDLLTRAGNFRVQRTLTTSPALYATSFFTAFSEQDILAIDRIVALRVEVLSARAEVDAADIMRIASDYYQRVVMFIAAYRKKCELAIDITMNTQDRNDTRRAARLLKQFDQATLRHGARTGVLVRSISDSLLASSDRDSVNGDHVAGAVLHDVGKVGVDPTLLVRQDDGLSRTEKLSMREHPVAGYLILRAAGFPASVCEAVLFHHERFDGTGYPAGLTGNDIPRAAQIIAVGDATDTSVRGRAYQAPRPTEAVLQMLEADAGTHFAPDVAQVARDVLPHVLAGRQKQ